MSLSLLLSLFTSKHFSWVCLRKQYLGADMLRFTEKKKKKENAKNKVIMITILYHHLITLKIIDSLFAHLEIIPLKILMIIL